jgi:zinc transport system permease protein
MFDLFNYEFIQRAFLAGTLLGIISPLIGNFLVVKRYSGLSDTLSHVSLLGISLGLVGGFFPPFIAILFSVFVSIFLVHYKGFEGIYKEAFLTLLMSASLAGVAIILKVSNGFRTSLFSYLFGSLNTVSQQNLIGLAFVSVASLIIVKVCYSKFLLVCFDEDFAKLKGVNVNLYKTLLAILAATVISFGIQIFGIMLMSAIIISPVIIALLFSRSFLGNILWSIAISLLSIWASIFLSFRIVDLPTSSLVVMFLFFGFLGVSLVSRK